MLNKLVNHFSESNDEFIIYLETKLYYEYEVKRGFFYWTVDQIAEHEGTMRTTLTTQIQELKTQIKKERRRKINERLWRCNYEKSLMNTVS